MLLPFLALLAAQELSGTVYLDRNANGMRDSGEPGVASVAVSNQDTVVATAADGSYRLLASGGHGLVFISVPSGYRVIGQFWRTAAQVESGAGAYNHVLALGGHVHIGERISYLRDGQATRFENSAATASPTKSGGWVFSSGFTAYEVRAGVIGEGRFVRLP